MVRLNDQPNKEPAHGTANFVWWKHGVVYQIYPRSFQDTDGDGVGDIQGIIQRLDYVADLGVDAIWLSPVYSSPMADFGYDVSDHNSIDPLFGNMETFRKLVHAVHASGLKLILDYIPNHTSDQHLWFKESRSSRSNPAATGLSGEIRPPRWTTEQLRRLRRAGLGMDGPTLSRRPRGRRYLALARIFFADGGLWL